MTTTTDFCTGVWQKCTWRHKPHYCPLMQIHVISMWMSRWIHFRCKYAHVADLSYSFDILASCQPDTPSLTIYNERLILDFKQTDASHLHSSVYLGVHYLATVASFLQGLAEIKCSCVLQPTFSLCLVLQLYLSLSSSASRLSLQKKNKKRKSGYIDRSCMKLLETNKTLTHSHRETQACCKKTFVDCAMFSVRHLFPLAAIVLYHSQVC